MDREPLRLDWERIQVSAAVAKPPMVWVSVDVPVICDAISARALVLYDNIDNTDHEIAFKDFTRRADMALAESGADIGPFTFTTPGFVVAGGLQWCHFAIELPGDASLSPQAAAWVRQTVEQALGELCEQLLVDPSQSPQARFVVDKILAAGHERTGDMAPQTPHADWPRMVVFKLERNPPFASWAVTVPLIGADADVHGIQMHTGLRELAQLFADQAPFEDATDGGGPLGLSDADITQTAEGAWFDFTIDMPADVELTAPQACWIRQAVDAALEKIARASRGAAHDPAALAFRDALQQA